MNRLSKIMILATTLMQGAATGLAIVRAIRIAKSLVRCPQCGQVMRISRGRRRSNGPTT